MVVRCWTRDRTPFSFPLALTLDFCIREARFRTPITLSRKRKNTTRATPSRPASSPAAPISTPRAWNPLHLAILVLLSLAIYAPTLRNGFVTDDRIQTLQNSLGLEAKNLGLAFTGHVWAFARTPKDAVHGANYYRPFQPLLYTAECQLWGASTSLR